MITNHIYVGHVTDVLQQHFEDESVDLLLESPPYYGLRSYGDDCIRVWGGSLDCQHEWVETVEKKEGYAGSKRWQHNVMRHQSPEKWNKESRKYAWCHKCGAWRGELGLEPEPTMYIDHIVEIIMAQKRVLKKTGSLWLNLGDTYYTHASKRSDQFGKGVVEGFDDLFTGDRVIHDDPNGWLQEKQLLAIPERVMIRLQDQGWILRNKVIWNKENNMPSSVTDRLTCSHEVIMYFIKNNDTIFWENKISKEIVTKKPKQRYIHQDGRIVETRPIRPDETQTTYADWFDEYGFPLYKSEWVGRTNYFDLDSIRQPLKASSLKRLSQDLSKQAGGEKEKQNKLVNDNLPVHIQGKEQSRILKNMKRKYPGEMNAGRASLYRDRSRVKYQGKLEGDDENHLVTSSPRARAYMGAPEWRFYNVDGKNPGDVWTIAVRPFAGAHFATFPPELIRPIIKAACPRDGVVLDPFMGSGTVARVCKEEKRKWVGIDIKKEYAELTMKRIKTSRYRPEPKGVKPFPYNESNPHTN